MPHNPLLYSHLANPLNVPLLAASLRQLETRDFMTRLRISMLSAAALMVAGLSADATAQEVTTTFSPLCDEAPRTTIVYPAARSIRGDVVIHTPRRTTTYRAPAPQYRAPAPQYRAPAPQYRAPAPHHCAPTRQCCAPAPQYQSAPQYYAPAPRTVRTSGTYRGHYYAPSNRYRTHGSHHTYVAPRRYVAPRYVAPHYVAPHHRYAATVARQNGPRVNKQAKRFGHQVNKQAKRFGYQVNNQAKRTGYQVNKQAKRTGRQVNKQAKRFGHQVNKQAKRTGRQVNKQTKRFGRQIGKESKRLGRSIGKAFKKIF